MKSVQVATTGVNPLLTPRGDQKPLSFAAEFQPAPLPEGTSLFFQEVTDTVPLVSEQQRAAYNSTLTAMKGNIEAGRPFSEGLVPETSTQPEAGQLPNSKQEPGSVDRQAEQQQIADAELSKVETVIKEFKTSIYGKFRGTVESEPPSKAYEELKKEENRELREALYGKTDGGQDTDSGLYDIIRNGELDPKVVLERMEKQGIDSAKALMIIQEVKDFLKAHPGKVEPTKEKEPPSTEKPDPANAKIGAVISKVEGASLELKGEAPKAGEKPENGKTPESGSVVIGSALKFTGVLPQPLEESAARITVFPLSEGMKRLEKEELETKVRDAIMSQNFKSGQEASFKTSKETTPAEKYLLLLEYRDAQGKWRPAAGLPFQTTDQTTE